MARRSPVTVLSDLEIKSGSGKALQVGLLMGSVAVAAICVLLPVWVILSSLEPPAEFFGSPPIIPTHLQWGKIVTVWTGLDFGQLYLNSFLVLVGSLLVALLFDGLFAYVLSKLRPRGAALMVTVLLWSMMLPNTLAIIATYRNIVSFPFGGLGLNGSNLINSFVPLWLMSSANAFVVIVFKSFFDGISDDYLEAAKIDGASTLAIFFRIIVPMSKPVYITVGILMTTYVWSDFFWQYLVLNGGNLQTVMVGLYGGSTSMPRDELLVALAFGMIPPVILFTFFQRYILSGFALTGLKG